jgi:multidrug efflux pump subunit AcrB
VASVLRTAVDGIDATAFREEDEEIAVRVRLPASQRRDLSDLDALPVYSPAAGRAVPLSQVASFEPGFTRRAILRYNRKREAFVQADVKSGHSLLTVAADVERAVRSRVTLPPGYRFYFHGQQEEVTESFLSLAKAAVVAVFLIYIILVVRFGSLLQPLLILLAIPMALVGASWGLALTGNPLSFMSFLGMISLTGIAVNDSIVLLDTINRKRRQAGLLLGDAIAEGALTRLRAVLLTSVTTIGGLLPLALGGGAFWAPFAFAMIFGLGASTVLTLVVQPAAYATLERLRGA